MSSKATGVHPESPNMGPKHPGKTGLCSKKMQGPALMNYCLSKTPLEPGTDDAEASDQAKYRYQAKGYSD